MNRAVVAFCSNVAKSRNQKLVSSTLLASRKSSLKVWQQVLFQRFFKEFVESVTVKNNVRILTYCYTLLERADSSETANVNWHAVAEVEGHLKQNINTYRDEMKMS